MSVRRERRNASISRLLVERELHGRQVRGGAGTSAGTTIEASLCRWVETDSLKHCTAFYCTLQPEPRSTIAAAFSPDGALLASTHGDHTVKIICCLTGKCVRTLLGHRRTPWVVRFHPRNSAVLASGSLDHEVRVWNATNAVCLAVQDFGRPISSLAFHMEEDLLAVASAEKLLLWDYSAASVTGNPRGEIRQAIGAKRALRAVQFHPRNSRMLLTAEVYKPGRAQEIPHTPATTRPLEVPGGTEWTATLAAAAARAAASHLSAHPAARPAYVAGAAPPAAEPDARRDLSERQSMLGVMAAAAAAAASAAPGPAPSSSSANPLAPDAGPTPMEDDSPPDPASSGPGAAVPNVLLPAELESGDLGAQLQAAVSALASVFSRGAAGAGGAAPAEQPCTVQLRVLEMDVARTSEGSPALSSSPAVCRLELHHVVLCSEMGTHFSPCGRFLAACVACRATPSGGGERGRQHTHGEAAAASSADAAHGAAPPPPPPPPGETIYELRVVSLLPESFGQILAARAVRAAHNLTSIQFSPSSEHILLAYGRRHSDLLRSFVNNNGAILPVYTIMEVYRVSDMSLVRVLPSAEDEVNVACFHSRPGGGLAYGTKEGRLRLLRHHSAAPRQRKEVRSARPCVEDDLLEAFETEAEAGGALSLLRAGGRDRF